MPAFVRPLIVAPHPDDETFGAGGLIAALTGAGMQPSSVLRPLACDVHVVFLTSGGAAHKDCCSISVAELCARREAVARKATTLLGVPESNLLFLRLEDGMLPRLGQAGFADACLRLARMIEQVQPDVVFAPHPFEGWSDHIAAEEITREAILQASKLKSLNFETLNTLKGIDCPSAFSLQPSALPMLYHYCVWFWLSMPLRKAFKVDWRNACTIALSPDSHQRKKQAIELYLNDKAPCGSPTCGLLPADFRCVSNWRAELFFAERKTRLPET